ncbi:hypothetical protein [Pseudomonas sp.]|uniref:hypothetical protein n=1 Tax=Pseudomonas sp. TaxID=306 RepID=UPI00260E25F6|nr:hypothetical protein [Pseudomonas sp.]
MTTNQTIDGVPRALLESFAAYVADSPNAVMRSRSAQLRALLDAPDQCAHEWESPALSSMPDYCAKCAVDKPAAQPQGEPVAMMNDGREGDPCIWFSRPPNGTKLYAEQPAPDIKLHVNVSNVKVTVNADGSYSIDPVEAPQACCGSCPGGCVYGLKA